MSYPFETNAMNGYSSLLNSVRSNVTIQGTEVKTNAEWKENHPIAMCRGTLLYKI